MQSWSSYEDAIAPEYKTTCAVLHRQVVFALSTRALKLSSCLRHLDENGLHCLFVVWQLLLNPIHNLIVGLLGIAHVVNLVKLLFTEHVGHIERKLLLRE